LRKYTLPSNIAPYEDNHYRHQQYVWSDVMQKLRIGEGPIVLDGETVRLNRLKYETFLRDYTENKFCCSTCGLEPTHAAVCSSGPSQERFINFFGIADGKEILFTHDHTLARSLGGQDRLENTTTMCVTCNTQKSQFESIYANHRLDIIKNYLKNSVGKTVSLTQLDKLAKNFDISGINPKFLTGSMYLLFFFNNESIFEKAVNILSARLGMDPQAYLQRCNTEGQKQSFTTEHTVFPFARIFYPQLNKHGVQQLRLDISRHLSLQWPNIITERPADDAFYDEITQRFFVKTHPGVGKYVPVDVFQEALSLTPELLIFPKVGQPSVHFGGTLIETTPQLHNFFKTPSRDENLVVCAIKTSKRRRALQVGKIESNTFVPYDPSADQIVALSASRIANEPRLSALQGMRYIDLPHSPIYAELMMEALSFKFQKPLDKITNNVHTKTNGALLNTLQNHFPHLSEKTQKMVAQTAVDPTEFFALCRQKAHHAKMRAKAQNAKSHNSKIKRNFARQEADSEAEFLHPQPRWR